MVRRPAKVRLIQVQVAAKVCGAAVYGIVQRCRAVVRRPTKVCVRQIGRTAEIRPVTVDCAAKIGFVHVGAPAEISGLIEEDSAELDGVEEGASRKIVFKVRPRAVLVTARIRGGAQTVTNLLHQTETQLSFFTQKSALRVKCAVRKLQGMRVKNRRRLNVPADLIDNALPLLIAVFVA